MAKGAVPVFGLAFGWGLEQIIAGAYQFLAANYESGDEIYIFGFSRGAYAARALAALTGGWPLAGAPG